MSLPDTLGAKLGTCWGEVTQDLLSPVPDRSRVWAALPVGDLEGGVFYKQGGPRFGFVVVVEVGVQTQESFNGQPVLGRRVSGV